MCERPEEIQDVFDYVAAEVPYLPVPNASTKKEFLKNASRVYRKPTVVRIAGAADPLREAFPLMVIEPLSDLLGRQPTRTEIIAALRTRHLSMNTSRKYAKLYDLTLRGLNRLTKAERQWLARPWGASRSLHNGGGQGRGGCWEKRFAQYFVFRLKPCYDFVLSQRHAGFGSTSSSDKSPLAGNSPLPFLIHTNNSSPYFWYSSVPF